MANELLKHALHYASLGLSVIPVHTVVGGKCSCGSLKCSAPGKHPMIKWRANTKESLGEDQIREWWKKHPDSNIGIVTGEISGIAVLDIDGLEGLKSLEEAGMPMHELPKSPTVRTGGGGIHIIFRYPERDKVKTQAGLLPKVDVRAEGGMIVAPPSLHSSGRKYEWSEGLTLDHLDPADFDFTLLSGSAVADKPKKPTTGDRWYEVYLKGVGEGERNNAAAKLAGRYFAMGMTTREVSLLLTAWNRVNDPPIQSRELARIISSIHDREFDEDNAERSEYLETISRLLRITLSSVKRITGDEPQFVLEFDEGTCTMTTGQLLSPKSFQQAVAEATKVVVRKLSTKTNPTHERMVQMIMNCAEDVDAGVEATGVGELTVLLKDFLSNQRTTPELSPGEPAPAHGSFRSGGLVWVSLMDLVQRSGARWGMKTSIRQMAQRLRALGVEREVFMVEGEADESRVMWGIDMEAIGLSERCSDVEED